MSEIDNVTYAVQSGASIGYSDSSILSGCAFRLEPGACLYRL